MGAGCGVEHLSVAVVVVAVVVVAVVVVAVVVVAVVPSPLLCFPPTGERLRLGLIGRIAEPLRRTMLIMMLCLVLGVLGV